MITDTERIDFLQGLGGGYTDRVICRFSRTGRGWRLHESSHEEAVPSVRDAIDKMMIDMCSPSTEKGPDNA